MNFITNTLKTITTGLAMQNTADYLSNTEKQTWMKKAVTHKQHAYKSTAPQKIDIDTAIIK
ncbi:hypothetical protein [uncultured Cocleimonas sp.]|uniref:hypothetical protein n=1 Tax=uncultured Cocleimonas sp. TaxID=1051587 RepID=UPI00262BCCB1|nr:hypothetical protein [uncultured Cocleimonas sp.]